MSFLKSRRLGFFLSRAALKSFLKSRRLSLFLSRAVTLVLSRAP